MSPFDSEINEKHSGCVDIRYNIEFFSNWHCGSGLAAGADVDSLVVKTPDGLPYVPGRTLKGLLRDAACELNGCGTDEASVSAGADKIAEVFGCGDEKAVASGQERTGCAFFGNATLPEGKTITANKLTPYLFQTFSSTAIDEDGIARDNTLRKIETVVPCTLEGTIRNVPEECVDLLEMAARMVKRMGTGRNRGYGRCCITIVR